MAGWWLVVISISHPNIPIASLEMIILVLRVIGLYHFSSFLIFLDFLFYDSLFHLVLAFIFQELLSQKAQGENATGVARLTSAHTLGSRTTSLRSPATSPA